MVKIYASIRIPKELHDAAKAYAKKNKRSFNFVVEEALTAHVEGGFPITETPVHKPEAKAETAKKLGKTQALLEAISRLKPEFTYKRLGRGCYNVFEKADIWNERIATEVGDIPSEWLVEKPTDSNEEDGLSFKDWLAKNPVDTNSD